MRQFRFEGQFINEISNGCVANGIDIKQTSEEYIYLARGSYAEIESNWLVSPSPSKIKVKTYIPAVHELDRLDEIADQKCIELLP